ncbi:helix-hairpin-helix domain-containing protein [Secundilactobacillus mixtipabuli]|uniref:Competence protein ComEA n=1 Tax=Secundilactobacillus mixtipabuli TaxID=1435342 RepID=A0A1Z5ICH5_9LACO|nr:helix-hairpin-helix domain-containing protein [Secundilactobacillus mixtipabuli]GAW99412.1 competence protein ComEA [Secundilactobacillus mixtipabuli]
MDRLRELLENSNRQAWIIIGLGFTTIIALSFLLLSNRPVSSTQPEFASQSFMSGSGMTASSSTAVTTSQTSVNTTMYVDVKGAVKQPGMKKVESTMRVIDAVQLAGGFASNADEKQVNLAQKLTDSQVVYIPKRGEQVPAAVSGTSGATAGGAGSESQAPQVNLNTADLTGLQQLDGVGEKKAQKILDYRQEHGGFKSADELKNVNGFGDKTLERLKPQIIV